MSYMDCFMCNGTGIDDGDWSGKCSSCNGSGMIPDDEEDDRGIDDDLDEKGDFA